VFGRFDSPPPTGPVPAKVGGAARELAQPTSAGLWIIRQLTTSPLRRGEAIYDEERPSGSKTVADPLDLSHFSAATPTPPRVSTTMQTAGMETTDLRLFADYHHIIVQDEDSETDISGGISHQAIADGLFTTEDEDDDDIVGIGTTVNMTVAVNVRLLDDEPDDDSAGFDHVVEASLHVPSGRIAVLGSTDELRGAAHFPVPSDRVRIRASRWNLAAAYRADIDSDKSPETTEQIRLQIWPAPQAPSRVIKRTDVPGT
jgi:hypothetical protein